MRIRRDIILFILNNRHHSIFQGLIESFKFANVVTLADKNFNLLFIFILRLILVLFFNYFLKAARLAKLDGHLARAAITTFLD